MVRKTISMPDEMAKWVESRIAEGQYGNDSEYFRDLIRREQEKRQAEDRLRTLIQEGVDSGICDDTLEDIWEEVKERHAEKV